MLPNNIVAGMTAKEISVAIFDLFIEDFSEYDIQLNVQTWHGLHGYLKCREFPLERSKWPILEHAQWLGAGDTGRPVYQEIITEMTLRLQQAIRNYEIRKYLAA